MYIHCLLSFIVVILPLKTTTMCLFNQLSLQMQEKITLLQKDRESEEDEEDQSILVEELQHCSPDKVGSILRVTHSYMYVLVLILIKPCDQSAGALILPFSPSLPIFYRSVRQYNHLNKASLV